jgi:exosortase E/protease (VPEID-CTERM system)
VEHTSPGGVGSQSGLQAASPWTWAVLIVPIAVLSLVALELTAYEAIYGDALWLLRTEGAHWRFWGYLGVVPKNLTWLVAGAGFIIVPWLATRRAISFPKNGKIPVAVAVHILACALMVMVTRAALDEGFTGALTAVPWLVFAAFPLWLSSAVLIWAPAGFWNTLIRMRGGQLAVVIGGTTFYKLLGLAWGNLEDAIANVLYAPTVGLASAMDRVLGYKVSSDAASRTLTVGGFDAEMMPACLGYVGLSLVLLFLAAYLYTSRHQLRFPNVLIVVPFALGAIWLLNATRIAMLMAIGASWSPEVAVNGFHSAAGWISLIVVCLVSVFTAQRFHSVPTQHLPAANGPTEDELRLIPELVLLGTSLLSMLFTGTFDWLYSVRVAAVAFVLVRLGGRLKLEGISLNVFPVVAGLLVFAGWISLVPENSARSLAFAGQLFAVPMWGAIIWIVGRCLGAVVIVPVAEELAFRGFLLDRAEDYFADRTSGYRRLAAAGVTSLAFGALHGSVLAGTLAGITFAAVRYHRGKLSDAICAHAVANLAIAVYAIGGGHWSYW